ncbi:hypothetical protein ED733_007536 [Metarhizium rileyi]|uniref:Aminoglycoside phosphotransferase domain-containing protein n=1 Tax=Metarhizium rileyi (strain RCEF 4871) TaxID=1649241 RepID=A0A5C6GKZ8_METRR|nr:hypothetical protein ED733_007536 [Metarhizium rileyi]
MASSATRQLLRGSVTLDDAISGDDNILRKLQYPEQKQRFWTSLADPSTSLPYKTGKVDAPGNSDEKLRTEIATYVWLEENCPDVPIPTLHAFGFPDGFHVMHTFIRPEYRHGPFFLTLTDLHQSNIFVDEQWNIKAIIDLEWAHAKPIEMQVPPYWLTSRAADGFNDADAIAEYDAILEEYLAIYAEEERRRNGVVVEAPIKRHVWKSGSFWYFHAVSIPKGMFNLFNRHIQPLFNTEHPDP